MKKTVEFYLKKIATLMAFNEMSAKVTAVLPNRSRFVSIDVINVIECDGNDGDSITCDECT